MSCSSPSVQAGSGAEPRSGAVLDLGGEKAVRPCRPHDVLRQFGVHNALRWALNSKRVQEGSLLQVVPGGGSCRGREQLGAEHCCQRCSGRCLSPKPPHRTPRSQLACWPASPGCRKRFSGPTAYNYGILGK